MNAKLFWLKFIFSLIFLLVKNQQVKAGKNDLEFPKMNVSEGALEIVTKMTNQLNEIAQPAADMSEKLKQNYRRLQKFIKVAIPVGAFAAAAMEIAFDPESEEMAALTKLHKEMNKQFEALAQRYEHLENKLISHQALTDYENEIVIPLESIREYFFLVCDPKTNRTHYRQQFVDRCQDRQSPYELLKIINRRVNRNCKTPTKLEASLSVQGMTLFDQIETKLSQFSTIDEAHFRKIRSESLYAFSSLSCCAEAMKCLAPLINAVNRNNTDVALETVLLAFHRNLTARFRQSRSASVFPCLLKIINDDNKWLRQPLENIVELVTLDVDRLLPIGILCANVSNNGDPEGTEHDIHRIKRLTGEIYDGMEYYIEKKLRSTWPEIQRFYVNNTLDSDVPTNLYNETAAKLKNQLDLRGPYRFFHNVIVSEPWHGNSAYYANYKKTFGFEIWDYRMVNVFVTRYQQDGQYNKARDAFHWWSRCFNNITTAIRIGYELYTYDLPKILDDIKTRTCSEPPSANSFLFLHTWKVWGSDEILAGVSNSTVTTIETIREVELYIPNNANRHRYRIYFIL